MKYVANDIWLIPKMKRHAEHYANIKRRDKAGQALLDGESKEIQDYAQAYSEMKPKQAAAIFEDMANNLDLAARILKEMTAEDRGKILGVMDSEIAAKLTKIMEPDS